MPVQGVRYVIIHEKDPYPYIKNVSYGILFGVLSSLLIDRLLRILGDKTIFYLMPYSLLTTLLLYIIIDPVPASIQGLMAMICIATLRIGVDSP